MKCEILMWRAEVVRWRRRRAIRDWALVTAMLPVVVVLVICVEWV